MFDRLVECNYVSALAYKVSLVMQFAGMWWRLLTPHQVVGGPLDATSADDAESSLAATLYSVEFDEIVIAAGGTPLGGAVLSDEQ